MKKLLFLPTLFLFALSVYAQNTSYEAWAKKQQEQYSKWKEMKASMAGLQSSPEMESISSFIDAGFNPNATPNQTQQTVPIPNATINYQQTSKMKVWVVIVGVATYADSRNTLSYTDDDAYKVYAFYKSPEGGAIPDSQIALLIDEDATRANVTKAIKAIFEKASKDDAIIFYFSGHGAEGAFITYEYDGNLIDSSGDYKGVLLHEELNDIFDHSPSNYKYIIADACHSGSYVVERKKTKSVSSVVDVTNNYYQAFEHSKGGFVMLLSSMGDEVSVETRGVRQGIFSYYLLRGLKGDADKNSDKVVSVIELYDYVESGVKKYTQEKQNPVLFGNYEDTMPFAIVR